ncbi:MAG: PilZ domain-containing protein [Myxococcota bacterium]
MGYSGSNQAKEARETLGKALAALQEDANIPEDVLAVAQNIAQAVAALFEAERASTEPDGKSCVRNALGSLSQTLALLQDVRGEHRGIALATEVIAKSMSSLYPLTTVPSKAPPPSTAAAAPQPIPKAAPVPSAAPSAPSPATASPAPASSPRESAEANIGATTESNFFVGFSGEISDGGVFLATYDVLPKGSLVDLLVTLPGGFEVRTPGKVRFVRDPLDFSADSEPGIGIQFDNLQADQRELILRFVRKRPPMFYDD